MSAAIVKIRLDWSGPGHYDAQRSLPCGCCQGPTKMRDRRGRAFHPSCAEQLIAEQVLAYAETLVVDERYGYTGQDLQQELLGPVSDAQLAVERVPATARALPAGGAR